MTGQPGSAIVGSLSRAWGVQQRSHGKQVWADAAVPLRLTLAIKYSFMTCNRGKKYPRPDEDCQA